MPMPISLLSASSAIGKVGTSYSQNVKTLDEYYDSLDQGLLPILRGIELTADDVLRRSIIQALMCHFELSIESIAIAHLIDFKSYFAPELEALAEMERAGLLRLEPEWITVPSTWPHAGESDRHGVRSLFARRTRARSLFESHLRRRTAHEVLTCLTQASLRFS